MSRAEISGIRQVGLRLLNRRKLLAGSAGLLTAASVASRPSAAGVFAQDSAATAVAVGLPGESIFEFMAVVHQRGFEFEMAGFLTRVAGIESSLLFSNPDPTNRSAANARLTIGGVINATSRSVVENIFDVNVEGPLGIYFNETAGADLATPESTRAGTQVGSVYARIQSIVTVTAPQTGLAQGFGDLTITESAPFAIAESTFQLDVSESRLRLSQVGSGVLLDPALPEALLHIAGNVSSAG